MSHLLDNIGPRVALTWPDIEALTARARGILREYPRARGFVAGTATRQAHLSALADEYGINLRTLYRYLRYRAPVTVRVGPWSATFAVKNEGKGTPVQLTSWIHDDEGA